MQNLLKCKECEKKFEPEEAPNFPEEGPNDRLQCPRCGSENWRPYSVPIPELSKAQVMMGKSRER